MKLVLMTMSICLVLCPAVSYGNGVEETNPPGAAQGKSEPGPQLKNLVVANPLGLLFGAFTFEFQRALSPNLAVLVAPGYASYSTSSDGTTIKSTGMSLDVGAVLYFSKHVFEAWYLKGTAGFIYASTSGAGSSSGTGFSAEALVGYRWLWSNGINLALALGARYMNFSIESDSTTLDFSGVGLGGELSLGFAW